MRSASYIHRHEVFLTRPQTQNYSLSLLLDFLVCNILKSSSLDDSSWQMPAPTISSWSSLRP
jgi:hypothetical protein